MVLLCSMIKTVLFVCFRFEGCEYQCQICMAMFFLSEKIRLHIKHEHKMSSDNYIHLYQKLESKSRVLSCFICNEDMKRNLFAINKHLEDVHNMDILKYEKKFYLTVHEVAYETFEAKVKVEPRSLKVKQGKPCPASKRKSTSYLEAATSAMPEKKAKLTTVKEWHQGTEYKCQICLDMFYETGTLVDHLMEAHKMAGRDYRAKYGRFSTRTVYYRCKICNHGMIHLEDTIQR